MIKLCYDVNDYRRQICDVISEDDTVIELGCHTGNTSKVILQNNVKLIAIDNSPEAKSEMDKLDLTFINADVRLHDTLSEVFKSVGLVEFYNSISEVNGDYKSQDGFLDSYKDSGIPPQIKEFDLWTPMPKK